ncbi:helix-turn-helix domain-containing protein [Actinomadura rubrisoli]|uniref:XRE family transcriptional regulator n=1 Tax=Actinomadura rubrisoli TaxID=2530368 RepID=A0A4R5CGZ9_9ACTN|nr:helix-turn-helix transcriptional regulator [Actinomadura rubrisoli]TDD97563.1 XRE family transcriptional regulator [Actinomadura rubrisoli]
MGTEEDKRFGVWLRREMELRGYEVDGSRAGGRTRLAKQTGISPSVISRILIDDRVPEIKALRAIGEVFGYSLGDMLVHAGVATAKEIAPSARLGPLVPAPPDDPDVPSDIGSRPLWEQYVWRTPGTTTDERRMMIFLNYLVRDQLDDIDALLALKSEVDGIVNRRLRKGRGKVS